MNDPVETEKCANCKLEILSSNYTIHCLHCVKHIYLCGKCEQPVNYNKKTDHDQTNHAFVSCFNCNIRLEKYLLKGHLESDCPFRKVKCPICDIEVVATDISEHENYCGSRTEKCSECGEFVMLKYKSLHIDSNHSINKLSYGELGPSPSWQNGKRTLHNFMPDLSSKTSKLFVDHKRKSNENNGRLRNLELNEPHIDSPQDEATKKNFDFMCNGKDKVQQPVESFRKIKGVKISSRTSIDEWPALTSLSSLQISEERENEPNGPEASSTSQTVDSDLIYAIQVSQGLNSDIWFKDSNAKDQALKNSFKLLAENHSSDEKIIQKNMFDTSKPAKVKSSRSNLDYFYEQEHVKLPCEFCGSLIISNELILHQSRCSLNMTEPSNRCSTRHKVPYFDESDDDSWGKKISCGVCNKVFKSSLLDSHEIIILPMWTQNYISHKETKKIYEFQTSNQSKMMQKEILLNLTFKNREWLSEFSESTERQKNFKNNLNCSETGGSSIRVKASRKSRQAPSPPRR